MAEAPGSDDPRSGEYLEAQIRLAKLQAETIEQRRRTELANLRWEHIHGRIRVLAEALALGLALLIFVASLALVIAAARDHALVVESFSVPPDFAQSGETGTVVATHLLDKIADMQEAAPSMRAPDSYQNDWGSDFKVQIPQTGISVSEAYRFLVVHIGHRVLITGEIVRTATGLALTVRVGGSSAKEIPGTNLDKLIGDAAEHVFEVTQPYRYGIYLANEKRNAESDKVLTKLAQSSTSSKERAWAYSGLLFNALAANKLDKAIRYGHEATALNAQLAPAYTNLVAAELRLGHDEAALADEVRQVNALKSNSSDISQQTATGYRFTAGGDLAGALGSFDTAAGFQRQAADTFPVGDYRHVRALLLEMMNLVRSHDPGAAVAELADPLPSLDIPGFADEKKIALAEIGARIEAARGNWKGAASLYESAVMPAHDVTGPFQLAVRSLLATARAEDRDFMGALAVIRDTPGDCYSCLVARGDIRAAGHRWKDADYWFADAASQGPSIPFAYCDWGAMLLAKGDADGAIAKFRLANAKGPHFADPLEMWGEALMLKNRSDLALAKFSEASKYAPSWGRLHLKWGEALYWAGDKDGAKKQFATAATLDLTPSEKAELAKH